MSRRLLRGAWPAVAASVLAAGVTAPLAAQSGRYNTDLGRLLRGRDLNPSALGSESFPRAAFALFGRGTFHADLFDLQLRLGTEQSSDRAEDDDRRYEAWSEFMVGRHAAEHGDRAGARGAFSRAGASAGGPLAPRVDAWRAYDAGAGADLDLRVFRGRRGFDPPDRVECAAQGSDVARARCELFRAAAVGESSADGIWRLAKRFADGYEADAAIVVDSVLTLRFYDPSTLDLLARADYAMASKLYEAAGDARLAGIAAALAGQTDRAETLLREAQGSIAAIYIALARFRSGAPESAETARSLLLGQIARGGDDELFALDAASAIMDVGDQALARFRKEGGNLSGLGAPRAERLARALVRSGHGAAALEVLTANIRPGDENDLARSTASYSVLLAHARYLEGREHFTASRRNLAELSDEFPVVLPTLQVLQQLTAPDRARSDRVRN